MNIKYKKLMFFLTFGIMGIGMSTFSFTTDNEDNKGRHSGGYSVQIEHVAADISDENYGGGTGLITTPSSIPSITDEPLITKSEEESDMTDAKLEKDAYPDINQLISTYLTAKLDSDSTYEGIVSSPDLVDAAKLASDAEIIKRYDNITCYTKKGINEISFIVYASYDVEILMLSAYVPSFDEFFVAFNQEGKFVIYNDKLSEETIEYIDMQRNSPNVVALMDEINQRFMKMVESDSDLKEFFNKISTE